MQHVERKPRSLRLELQGNEGSTPIGVYSPHIHQGRLQASQATTKENEPSHQRHSQERTLNLYGQRVVKRPSTF